MELQLNVEEKKALEVSHFNGSCDKSEQHKWVSE